jgi:hypothetical protein
MCLQNAIKSGFKSGVDSFKHGASLGFISAPNSLENGRKERKQRQ